MIFLAAKPNSILKENADLEPNAHIQESLTDAPPELQNIIKDPPIGTCCKYIVLFKSLFMTVHYRYENIGFSFLNVKQIINNTSKIHRF